MEWLTGDDIALEYGFIRLKVPPSSSLAQDAGFSCRQQGFKSPRGYYGEQDKTHRLTDVFFLVKMFADDVRFFYNI